MDKQEVIKCLQKLLSDITEKERLDRKLQELHWNLVSEKSKKFSKIEEFDFLHQNEYISQRLGKKPIRPKKMLGIISRKKKLKEYEDSLLKYRERQKLLEKDYFQVFEKERNEILEKEKKDQEYNINSILSEINSVEKAQLDIADKIERVDVVTAALKNKLDITELILILDNGRADVIKEAINVMCEDRHRRKIEELYQEQIDLTREAKLAAERAENSASVAAEAAKEAAAKSEEAYYMASNAYYQAQNAYNKADEAYERASSTCN